MSSSYGENLLLTIFGQSHSAAIGMTLQGVPAGEEIDLARLQAFLDRRAPGKNAWSTPRREADAPEFLSGLVGNVTCGAPMTVILRNTNTRPADYETLRRVPRPGHADYTASVKYFGAQDVSGGGHFSGRLTAPMCVAGGICLQLLEKEGISVRARVRSIGEGVDDSPFLSPVDQSDFPAVSPEKAEGMKQTIAQAREAGDSVGGVIECVAEGLPAGLGDPMFGGMENRIAAIVFGIPAVKGIEFGLGFEVARLRGSQVNDPFTVEDGRVRTKTNRAGGILGGITDGMPLVFRAAFKPTPSIAAPQESVNLQTLSPESLTVAGRHDPCIVPRAVPCVESAAAIAIYDALLGRRKETCHGPQ